ncbi:hypothetical protein GCM10010124_39670 [Pilimelia terevasa]|uniref:Uncharacterized protein n=1 Tax=Pilimelia terevasa TaxID=53372 RepID=A0A8J3BV50_9ACTN|nr:hypothetical protein GCM10010124_39670 [Pilimelia terevasa]
MVAGLVLLTACGSDPAPRPAPIPTAAPTDVAPTQTLPAPSASFKSSIKQDDKTFWMSIGGLPTNSYAETKSERTAPMTFRLECDRGQLNTRLNFNGQPRFFQHSCADGMFKSDLGTIKTGTKVQIFMDGTAGTSYVADMRWP